MLSPKVTFIFHPISARTFSIASDFVRPWIWIPFTVISASISVSGSVVVSSVDVSDPASCLPDLAQLWSPTATQIRKITTPIAIRTIFAISGP